MGFLKFSLGKTFVHYYYHYSPYWAHRLMEHPLILHSIRSLLNFFIVLLKHPSLLLLLLLLPFLFFLKKIFSLLSLFSILPLSLFFHSPSLHAQLSSPSFFNAKKTDNPAAILWKRPAMNAALSYQKADKIDESKIPHALWNKPLATYDGGEFSLGQFVSMYNGMNFTSRVPLHYDDEIENHIKTLVVPYLMYQDGVQMGLQNSDDFKLLYEKMRTNALKQEALRKFVYEKVQVTDDEVKSYYEQHKQEWNNQPFQKIERFAKNRLKAEKAKQYKEQLTRRLRNSYTVVYNDSLIAAVATSLDNMKKSGPMFRVPNFQHK